MASKYWIKLYHEVLDDPKMGRLSNRLWRRAIELFLIAGDYDQGGELPNVGDMAWRLRISEDDLLADLDALENIHIVSLNGAMHVVTNFAKRQSAVSDAERMRRYRDRNRTSDDVVINTVTNDVTIRNTDTDTDTEIDTEIDETTTILETWAVLFPSKQQPRRATISAKVKTRLKDTGFRRDWRKALERVKDSTFCLEGNWFTLSWFLNSENNWTKCLDGNYDNHKGNGSAPQYATPVPEGMYRDPDDEFAIQGATQ